MSCWARPGHPGSILHQLPGSLWKDLRTAFGAAFTHWLLPWLSGQGWLHGHDCLSVELPPRASHLGRSLGEDADGVYPGPRRGAGG